MLKFSLFNAVYVLFGVISAIDASSFQYVENQIPFSITPHFIYVSSKPSAVSSGYSYTTQDFNGAKSNVVFTTGADSMKNLKIGVESVYKPMVMMPKENAPMDMQEASGKSSMSSMGPSESQAMDLEMKNVIDANIQLPYQQNQELNEIQDYNRGTGQQITQQPLSFLQNPVLERNPLQLRFPTIIPKLYILPNTLETLRYTDNTYGHVGIPAYTVKNPFVRLFYQSPYVPTVNPFHDAFINKKALYNFYDSNDNKSVKPNCTNSNVVPTTNKVTPASEFVTGQSKNITLQETSTSTPNNVANTTEASKDSTDQLGIKKSNNTETTNENVMLPIKTMTDVSATTNVTNT